MGVMANSILSARVLQDEAAAIAWVEARVWPEGPVCPHCGNCNGEKIGKLTGKTARPGLRKCYECRKQFTVKVGTVFEDSHVPMNLWLQAMYLLCSSKKGISSNQLSRTLGVTLKTAWFMSHRIREAMRVVGVAPMGGPDVVIEVDETVIGRRQGIGGKSVRKARAGFAHKNVVMTLVQRDGIARSFHIDGVRAEDVVPVMENNIARESAIMTDELRSYTEVGQKFASHETVTHSKDEYVRYTKDRVITTNTVEGYFSIFKRGMKGIYQHCSEKHLHRYLAEFDFRYNHREALGWNDENRTIAAIRSGEGKRLTYHPVD
jgi:transposase-like protein